MTSEDKIERLDDFLKDHIQIEVEGIENCKQLAKKHPESKSLWNDVARTAKERALAFATVKNFIDQL